MNELANEYTLVIISSSSEESISSFLSKYNLRHHFSEILGRETHRNKVDKFHMILDKYRINPHETLIITDTAGDIKEANDVGVRSIGVIWGVHDEDKLAQVNPHFVAKEPSELISGIKAVLN